MTTTSPLRGGQALVTPPSDATAGAAHEYPTPPWRIVADPQAGTLRVRNEAPWALSDATITLFDQGGFTTVITRDTVQPGEEVTTRNADGHMVDVIGIRWRDRTRLARRRAMVRVTPSGPAAPAAPVAPEGPHGHTPADAGPADQPASGPTVPPAPDSVPAVPAVPVTRLRTLLVDARTARGLTPRQVSIALGGRIDARRLKQYERGAALPSDAELRLLADLYHGEARTIVPPRATLFVLPTAALRRSADHQLARSNAEVLARYLAIVYHLRNADVRTPIALRINDLTVLASFLDESPDDLRPKLDALMNAPETLQRYTFEFLTRPAERRVNITIAVTPNGALVLGRPRPARRRRDR